MTLRSMTGYGQAGGMTAIGALTVEIRSVNHRHFDCVVRAPKDFLAVEDEIKQTLQASLSRGRIDVFISVQQSEAQRGLDVDWTLLQKLKLAAHRLQAEGYPVAQATALEWLQFPGVLQSVPVETAELHEAVMPLLAAALNDLSAMRVREGERLGQSLRQKLEEMKAQAGVLEERCPEVLAAMTRRLQSRLEDLVNQADDSRVLTEVAIMADKLAIDEEVTRLYSHIEEFSLSLTRNEPVGKRLDFISQEMFREVNTIASKSPDLVVSKTVVNLKAVIEQLREQVQNIE